MSVLLTNSSWRISKEAMKSLDKQNITSIAGDVSTPFINVFPHTNYVKYANPESESFADSVYNICSNYKVESIFSMSNDVAVSISKNKKYLSEVCEVPIAEYKDLFKAHDKFETYKIAKSLSIPTPESYVFDDYNSLLTFSENTKYPLIIKPRVGGGASTHLHLVNSKEELLHYYSELIVDKCEPIIQEYIPGSSEQMYMINVLYSKDNELLAYFMAKKVREYPPGGGITCCGVSIYEPALLEFAKKMFHELNWYGVAEIEFKLDTRDKQFKLIEINPRFWQYLKLPIYCGVDFPYLLYRTANGYEVEEVAEYKKDVHYINVVKDIPSISKSLLVSENKSEYLLSVINSYKGDKTYSSKIGIESILWRV